MKADVTEIRSRTFGRILAFLLSFTLSSAVFSVYSISFFSLWTLGTLVITLLAFLLCEFVNRHHFVGGIILTVIIMRAFSAFFRLIMGNDYGDSFQRWFLTGAEQVSTRITYLLALLISFVPFFAVVIFYFSQVLYRMSFLTLISLIPCALYVKVLSEIDNVYISLIAILNIAMLINNNRNMQNEDRKVSGNKAALLSGAVFVFAVLIISAVIPKENEAKYYDRFEELFMDSNFQIKLDESYSMFSNFSGNADNYRNFSNRRMYMLYGENVPYFKRQTFDYYDFENDRWYADDKYATAEFTCDGWAEERQLLGLEGIREAVIRADGYEDGFIEKYGLEKLAGYSDFKDEVKEVFVQPQVFSAIYYLSPARGIRINEFSNQEDIYVTGHGVFRNLINVHGETASYSVKYFDEFRSRFLWFELGGSDFTDSEYREMLAELNRILNENNDELEVISQAFEEDYNKSVEYNRLCQENNRNISEEIKLLAEQITEGLSYDWEKATAIQNYFVNEGYIYDLDYISDDTSPEYFLFESKRGSCSDYASAYVLMARSLGLTVRYAEGYNPDVTSYENQFVIKDSCSHAYPEVYIQNMGWIVFEPTVPSNYSQTENQGAANAVEIDYDLISVLCLISALILIIILILIFLIPVISEKRFIKKAMAEASGMCAVMIYKRIITVNSLSIVKNAECMTPCEYCGKLAVLTGCDIGQLVCAVEKYSYGGMDVSDYDNQQAVECYYNVKRAIKAYKKENNIIRRRNKRK